MITGRSGSVSVGSSINEVESWSLTVEQDSQEANIMSDSNDGWKNFVVGLKSASGSVTFDEGASAVSVGSLITGSNCACDVTLNTGSGAGCDTGSGITIDGSAFLSNFNAEAGASDIVQYSADFQFTGSIGIAATE